MFIQVSDKVVINAKTMLYFMKTHVNPKEDETVYCILFIYLAGSQAIEFKSEYTRDKMFNELMRKINCMEWNGN
jgi:hypothetical protein